MPCLDSFSKPGGDSATLIESKPIPCERKNSFARKQLVQPGCQNKVIGSGILIPFRLFLGKLVNSREIDTGHRGQHMFKNTPN